MAIVEELLREEADGTISFGNYTLPTKAKLENFRHGGDLLKVKTFKEITKLEKNDSFAYESVPGTAVHAFAETDAGVSFVAEGAGDVKITLGLADSTEYDVFIDGEKEGRMKTGLGGKLTLSADLSEGRTASVQVKKA